VHKELAEQLARLIEHTLHGLSSDDARVHLLGEQLVGFLRQPDRQPAPSSSCWATSPSACLSLPE
jgi:diguanylate cyclase